MPGRADGLQRRDGLGLFRQIGPHGGRYANAAHRQRGETDEDQESRDPLHEPPHPRRPVSSVAPAPAERLRLILERCFQRRQIGAFRQTQAQRALVE